jgi:hypothetical protein
MIYMIYSTYQLPSANGVLCASKYKRIEFARRNGQDSFYALARGQRAKGFPRIIRRTVSAQSPPPPQVAKGVPRAMDGVDLSHHQLLASVARLPHAKLRLRGW